MALGSRRQARMGAALAAALFTAAAAASFAGGTGTRTAPVPSGSAIASPRGLHERRASRRAEDIDPPEVQVGERLFLETRFAQYFFAHSNDMNAPLVEGDPVMNTLPTSNGPLPGPFVGLSMNCRNCHLVDDTAEAPTRTYADFSRKSVVPEREDGLTRTPRNSPSLVNANLDRQVPFLLHFDGEFASLDALVTATLSGRNYGWLPLEAPVAVSHIARVVREDDGSDALAQSFGGVSYRILLAGTDPSIPAELRLPEPYLLDVASATDSDVVAAVTRLIAAYTASLTFANVSPYDVFLAKNGLPAAPEPGESDIDYSRRLRAAVSALTSPEYVDAADGEFAEHDQEFVFGPDELKGLKIFLREPVSNTLSTRTGNCIACHAAPRFTDFSFHNTGATQEEFDGQNGEGAFQRLFIPDLDYRNARYDEFLPATAQHPLASGRFRTAPLDLGLWNIYANPDFPAPQAALEQVLGPASAVSLHDATARFKTPGLRDLGQSGPYLHTGKKRELEEVLELYVSSSTRERQGRLRNGDPALAGIFLGEGDLEPLVAFLSSLNEDYN